MHKVTATACESYSDTISVKNMNVILGSTLYMSRDEAESRIPSYLHDLETLHGYGRQIIDRTTFSVVEASESEIASFYGQ